MRIWDFPKLIVREQTQEISLRNCSVVIDGQNYLHNIYERSKIPFIFGCETDKYAEYLKEHFKMFEQANVKCFIVFKGGDTNIEKKIQRFQHLIFNVHTNFEFIPPVLLKDATAQVIADMAIDYAFCVTESKDDCVALAQKLECPVISYDIEFCFRKAPYIPSVTLKFDIKSKSIKCRLFKLENFLQKNSLTLEKIAIFATLTDTTVFPENFFDTLFHTWRVLNTYESIKLKNLILWLSKHSKQKAWHAITKNLTNNQDRTKFQINYQHILAIMEKEEGGHATEYLLNSNVQIKKSDPEWFEKGVICKHVPPTYINLYKSKVIQGSWVVLDTQSEDSLLLSIDIIKYAYNLLTNYQEDTIKVFQDGDKYLEIDTENQLIRKPNYSCNKSVFENGWDGVKDLKLFEHFLTESDINVEILAEAGLPDDCHVLLIALVYFARKKQLTEQDVTREVHAILLSYVVLSSAISTDITCEDYLKVQRITEKYNRYDEVESRSIFDGEVLARFAELQYCIQHMNYLNTLCGSPFKSSQYRRIYNGTFIFKIFCEMRGNDGEGFVNELLQSVPSVLAVFKELIQVYRELYCSYLYAL